MCLTTTEQTGGDLKADPRKQNNVMITGMKIKYATEIPSFPEANLTDTPARAHTHTHSCTNPQTAALFVATVTSHNARAGSCGGAHGLREAVSLLPLCSSLQTRCP